MVHGIYSKRDSRKSQGPATKKAGKGLILVADDDAEFLSLLIDILAGLSFEVRGFTTATEALKILRRETSTSDNRGPVTPIIISDNMMPLMTGLEFLKIVHKEFPHVPFLMLTGFGSQETREAAMDGGAFAFLTKPFNLSELEHTVLKAFSSIATRNIG